MDGSAPRSIDPADLVRNTLTSHAERLLDMAVLLLVFPFVLARLGADQFGLWNLIWAVLGVLALVDAGFQTSVVKYVADARGREDGDRFHGVVATLFWVFVVQTVVVLALLAVLCACFPPLFNLPPALVPAARAALLVVGGGYALTLPLNLFRGILIGSQQVWVVNAYRMGGTLIYALAVWLCLSRWPDLRLLALISLLATAAPLLLTALHARVRHPSLRLHPRFFDRRLLAEVWSFSSCFLLIQVAGLIATRANAFVVGAALPLGAVAIYAIGLRVSTRAGDLCAQVSRALSPVVAELHGAGEDERLRRLWLNGSMIGVAFATPLLLGCAMLARPLVVAWVGPACLEAATVLQFLLAACLLEVVHFNSLDQLSMRGEQRFLSFAVVGGQVLNLGLAMVLVGVWGVVGVASAALAVPLVVDVWLVMGRLRRRFGLTRGELYARAVLPSVAPVAAMAAVLAAWQRLHPIGSLAEVALAEAVAACLFWTVFWWTGLGSDGRARARSLAMEVARRLSARSRGVHVPAVSGS